jgi:fatty acid-binding protein DegV
MQNQIVRFTGAGERQPALRTHPAVDLTPVIGAHIGPGAVGFAVISAASEDSKD